MNSPINDTIFSLSSGGTEKGSLNATASNTTKITRQAASPWLEKLLKPKHGLTLNALADACYPDVFIGRLTVVTPVTLTLL